MNNLTREKIDITPEDIQSLSRLENGTDNQRRTHVIACEILLLNDFKSFVLKTREKIGITQDSIDTGVLFVIKDTMEDLYNPGKTKVYKTKKDEERLSKEIFKYVHSKPYFEKYYKKDMYSYEILIYIITEYIKYGIINNNGYLGKVEYQNGGGEDGYGDKVLITVHPDITKDELTYFIKEKLFLIKEYGRIANTRRKNDQKRIRVYKKFDKDILIYNDYLDLIEKRKDVKEDKYIETTLTKEIKKKFNRFTTEEGTKKILSRMRKKVHEINKEDN